MSSQIYLDNVGETMWADNFLKLLKEPAPNVRSILEVIGGVCLSALSIHCKYLAVVSEFSSRLCLFIVALEDRRVELIKRFPSPCTAMQFMFTTEQNLFVATKCGSFFLLDVESGKEFSLGHNLVIDGISCDSKSNLILTWHSSEVLLWSWPSCSSKSRLRVDRQSTVVWAYHIKETNVLLVGFDCGTVILWERDNSMKETVLKAPTGVDMLFTSFSVSMDGNWLVGVGTDSLMVVYSLTNFKVNQVVNLIKPFSSIRLVKFLPQIHPKFPQIFMLLSDEGAIMVSDFANFQKIKSLKTLRHPINAVSASGDGYLLGVSYANGCLKLYTMLSFFPPIAGELAAQDPGPLEATFTLMKDKEKQESKGKLKDKSNLKGLLDREKWLTIIDEVGEYPLKYRRLIWISILKLPQNFSVMSSLLDKGPHPAYQSQEILPNVHPSLNESLISTLNCLAHWCPSFTSVSFLPDFILPFVRYFQPNLLLCFESCATLLISWGPHLLESWPNYPNKLFKFIEDILCQQEPDLLAHLRKLEATPKSYIWPLLTSSFYKVTSNDDWFILWDNILSKPPHYLLCIVIAFIVCLKQSFMSCTKTAQVEKICNEQSWISSRIILKKCHNLYSLLESRSAFNQFTKEFQPLPQGGLPIFDLNCSNREEESPKNMSLTELNKESYSATNKYLEFNDFTLTELREKEKRCLNRIKNLRKRPACKFLE